MGIHNYHSKVVLLMLDTSSYYFSTPAVAALPYTMTHSLTASATLETGHALQSYGFEEHCPR